jgi:hypothetical protein
MATASLKTGNGSRLAQLELFPVEPLEPLAAFCDCGRELHEHIEHYRGTCGRCINRLGMAGARFHDADPEHKRRHLQSWLEQRRRRGALPR